MRKLNMILVIGMLVTFLLHSIMGALRLAGADADSMKIAARACVGFITAHMAVSVILTIQTLYARKKSGAGYLKGNGLFWARRISGFAIVIPLILHILIFRAADTDAYRLAVFGRGKLIASLLLVAAIAVHVICNIRPVLISFGVKDTRRFAVDILLILAAVLLFLGIAFAVYYFRWTTV